MKKMKLSCTQCQKTYPLEHAYPRCDICKEPLELESVTRGEIKPGEPLRQSLLERYAEFFPFLEINSALALHEGLTPLEESSKLAKALGLKRILFKNETLNPTWTFKDRGTAVALHHALLQGFRRIGTVSTGNMAVSVAAYGARAGVQTFVLVSANLPQEKLNPIAVYNPITIRVEGDYSELYSESLKLGRQQQIYFMNSDAPFRVEGSKTIAFEICEQLNFEVPDYVVVPTSSGGNFRGILKGFEEFRGCGLIDTLPRMVCAQASGCSPIYNADVEGQESITRIEKPQTIAHALANPYPPSGNAVLRKLRETEGLCVAADDEEILEAQRQLAEETGIFGQPASAVPLAAVKKLSQQGILTEGDTVVCIVTGSGLKYTAALEKRPLRINSCALPELAERIQSLS